MYSLSSVSRTLNNTFFATWGQRKQAVNTQVLLLGKLEQMITCTHLADTLKTSPLNLLDFCTSIQHDLKVT